MEGSPRQRGGGRAPLPPARQREPVSLKLKGMEVQHKVRFLNCKYLSLWGWRRGRR